MAFVISAVFLAISAWFLLPKLCVLLRERLKLVELIDRIPGPPAIPLLGCAYAFKLDNIEFVDQVEEWGQKYAFGSEGSGMMRTWLGPLPVVMVCRDAIVKKVLDNSRNISKPSLMYSFLSRWLGTGLLTSYEGKWHSRRKLLTPAFHFNILNRFVPIFSKQSEVFVEQIKKHAEENEEFDLFPYIKRCALDIICETAMGAEIGAQTGKNLEYVNAVAAMSRLIWHHERLPWMWVKPIWYSSGNGFAFDEALEVTLQFTKKIIAERQKAFKKIGTFYPQNEENVGTRKLAFLDLLLNMQAKNQLSDEDFREEVDTFMFAGHDTTSSAIGFTIWLLAQFPHLQSKIHEELDAVFGDSQRSATPEDLRQLPYLDKCIKEALRLAPPVPVVGRVLTEDVEHKGKVIPKGVTVVAAIVALHRDQKNFSNPDTFDPENFSPENTSKRHPYSFIPFAAGPRNCIGQKFALLEMKTVVSRFFRSYSVMTSQDNRTNRALPELVLTPSKGFIVTIRERTK
ncbi:hypothetical protein L596_011821 [Steinernema carpocapsae]|uniref:Cytochrome P450 n=1 Tax=Steinernema carpocapsae TaxID=34508 RepID=A0A4U5NW18_STECR|nr:hypothetical protein L596_011821 [Steinernema carpocapsae]